MTSDRHILLVDDNPRTIEFLDQRLKALGYRTTLAGNGEAALDCVRKDPPLIVVMDVTMPEMNGYQACREIKKIDKNIPVIILTAKSDPADRFWAFQSGATEFYNKPFDPDVVLKKITALIGTR